MDNKDRSDLVRVVTAPLGFFALSLLIVEGFLGIVLIFSGLDPIYKFYGMIIGSGLFALVVLGVWILVLIKPTSLTFGEQSHLEHEKMNFGTEKNRDKDLRDEKAQNKDI